MIMVGGSFFHSFFLLSPRALGPHGGLFHFVVCLFSFGGLGQLTVLRMSRKKGKKSKNNLHQSVLKVIGSGVVS